MTEYKYGEIVLLDFNPIRGSEISKIRPCIIVSRNIINKYSPLIIVLPTTSNTDKILPYHTLIKPSKKNGLKLKSKVLPEQIKSLDKSRICKKIGQIQPILMKEIEKSLLFVINQSN